MSLLTENNRQYYEGAQGFLGDGTQTQFTTTFDTSLIYFSADPTDVDYGENNFKLYSSTTAIPGSWVEYTGGWSIKANSNTIVFTVAPVNGLNIVCQLKRLDGGNYGVTSADKAFGNTVEENYGSYSYIKLNDIVNNFITGFVGAGKLIQDVKRTDVIFHVKRAVQEFSYDTLRSVKSQELTIPKGLSVIMPQDYVNYVELSWIDTQGIKHIIYPTTLTTNPYTMPIQDTLGIPTQDSNDNNITGTSIIDKRWRDNNFNNFSNTNLTNVQDTSAFSDFFYGSNGRLFGYGQLYGMNPELANANGWFTINDREGKMSFSGNLVDKIILFQYVSDGLASDLDTKIPKMAEEAMYSYLKHAILASRINQPEYVIQRFKKEARATLRNAKIRLSNLKANEIVQTMRGKSKWIKT